MGCFCHQQIIIHFSPPLLKDQPKYGREVLLLLCQLQLIILLGINYNRNLTPASWCCLKLRQSFRTTVEFLSLFLCLLRNSLHLATKFLVFLPLTIFLLILIKSDSFVLWPNCFTTRCKKILQHQMTKYQNRSWKAPKSL